MVSGDFEYEWVGDDGVEIVGYLGTDTEVFVPDEIDGLDVLSIGQAAFFFKEITSVELPDTLLEIKANAFASCGQLCDVFFGFGLIKIGANAFCGCRALEDIALPDGLEEIGDCAFGWCSGALSLTLPDSLLSVGEKAFCFCTSLSGVIVPSGVEVMGYVAFNGCRGGDNPDFRIFCVADAPGAAWDVDWNEGEEDNVDWGCA